MSQRNDDTSLLSLGLQELEAAFELGGDAVSVEVRGDFCDHKIKLRYLLYLTRYSLLNKKKGFFFRIIYMYLLIYLSYCLHASDIMYLSNPHLNYFV